MMKKAAVILVMLIFMAVLPFITAKCCNSNINTRNVMSTADTPTKSEIVLSDDKSLLSALTASKIKSDYCEETIKALAIILNTNYSVNPTSFNEADFLYKDKASGNILEMYPKIESIVNSVKEKTLCKNDKAFYIPFSETSNGFTYTSDDYDYLQAVSSVWDSFSDSYDENIRCVGVSISGIDYLCKNGESAEQALKWYLPDFQIR